MRQSTSHTSGRRIHEADFKRALGEFLERKGISVTPDFAIGRVDSAEKKIVSWDENQVNYDVLVSVPTNMGDPCIARSGLGNELNFVPTNKQTLAADGLEDVFVIGDATNVPASKAGSVVHFQSEILFENIMEHIEGHPPAPISTDMRTASLSPDSAKGCSSFQLRNRAVAGCFPASRCGPVQTPG